MIFWWVEMTVFKTSITNRRTVFHQKQIEIPSTRTKAVKGFQETKFKI